MARNVSGTYSLPAKNPVVTGTAIESDWGNTTLADIAAALTDSLSRNGNGGMLVPLQFLDGTVGAPGITFTNENTSGIRRASAGDVRMVIGGSDVFQFTAAGGKYWDGTAWAAFPLLTTANVWTLDQTLANTKGLLIRDSGGTARNVAALTAGNIVQLGNTATAMVLYAAAGQGWSFNNGADRLTLSPTGTLTAAAFSGPLTGNVTGNCSGTAYGKAEGSLSVSYAASAGSAPASDVYAWAKAAAKPSYAFNEISSAAISATTGTFSGAIGCSALTATGDVTAYSDERLKTAIVPIVGALHRVGKLRAITFERKDDPTRVRSMGLVAQDVREVAPELVREDGKGFLSVAYGNAVALLVAAVNELASKVEALEAP